MKEHLKHVSRHSPSGPEIPDFILSAIMLLSWPTEASAGDVGHLPMYSTLVPAGFSSDHAVKVHVHVGELRFCLPWIMWSNATDKSQKAK